MGKKRTIPLEFQRGMWTSGDLSQMPKGFAKKIRNMFLRPGRAAQRPQFTWDNVTPGYAFFLWNDGTNRKQRLVVTTTNGNARVKDLTGEGWGSPITGQINTTPVDWCDYRGVTYIASATHTGGGVATGTTVTSFRGTAIDATPLSPSVHGGSFEPITITSYIERIFFGAPRLLVTNRLSATQTYQPTAWTLTSCSAANLAIGTSTVGRLTPTATTGALADLGTLNFSLGSATELGVVWSCDLRGVDPTYRLPMTLELLLRIPWVAATPYVVGDFATPTTPNAFRYRCTVNGTSAGVEPTWPTTLGTTVVDGGVTWICDGSSTLGSAAIQVPSASDSSTYTRFWCDGLLPLINNWASIRVVPRLKFGTTDTPTITLAPVDVSLKDALTDGDPKKRNYGQQVTTGTFRFPFCNREDGGTATIHHEDYLYFSEIGQPTRIQASNFYRLQDTPGPVTAARVIGGRLVVFKRDAIWVFQGNDDPQTLADIPISREVVLRDIGCIYPTAIDTFENVLFFIGDNEVYGWRIGSQPVPLCGDGMRDEIMSRGSDWVLALADQEWNQPRLRVDKKRRELWVYTQKGRFYVYSLGQVDPLSDAAGWQVVDVGAGADGTVGKQIYDMAFHPGTGNMYFAWAANVGGGETARGVSRLDATVAGTTDAVSATETYNVHAEIIAAPIETFAPRYDAVIEEVGIHHAITASQSGQNTTVYCSFDQGVTWAKNNVINIDDLSGGDKNRVPVPLYQLAPSLTVRVLHEGSGGEANFNVSGLDATLNIKRGEYPQETPTNVSSSL